MEPLMAYGGNNLMNMVVSKTYTAQRDRFKGSGNHSGIAYTFDVKDVPVATLVANVATHNLKIDLSVAVTASGQGVNFNNTISVQATGKLAVAQGILSLTAMNLTTTSANVGDQLVISIVKSQIIPRIKAALGGIPIPQLTNLFGSGLSASLRTGAIIAGPALETGARITGRSGIAAADVPTAANISALNGGSSASALAIGIVSSRAVNVLVTALVPRLSISFDERVSAAGFDAGIRGIIRATTPVLTVSNGSAVATTTISFSNLRGGIDTPFTDWYWVSLTAPTARVMIGHKLSTSGRAGVLTLTSVDKIQVSLNSHPALLPAEKLLNGLLADVLKQFRNEISNALKGQKIELFKLPATIPGTNIGATLSFDSNGLGYFGSSVRALVRIQTV
jgi:hypothetical protein